MAVMYGLDEKLAALTPDDVLKAYAGKVGCACGCGGRYSYVDPVAGEADRGYPVGDDEVSRSRVAKVLATVQEHTAEVTFYDFGCFEYETERRAFRVYLKGAL
jgi:hypothetical protein